MQLEKPPPVSLPLRMCDTGTRPGIAIRTILFGLTDCV